MIQGFSGGLLNRELIYNLDLPNFQRDFASLKTLDHGTGPAITFTRASGATYFDADGVLQTAANDVARFDHSQDGAANSLGLLIEEARTNSIRNSQAGGSTNGVIGSGGALPTNWSAVAPIGVSVEVIGTGTLNGFSYLDIKFSGTRSGGATASIALFTEPTTSTVAATGQTWTASAYIAVIAGDLTNITNSQLGVSERSVTGTQLIVSTIPLSGLSATLARYSVTRTFNQATTERTTTQFAGGVADGATIDITLRIAAPQLELGAFPTSYIPTTSAAATRSVDSAVVTPISSFYNQSEGTLFAEWASGPSGVVSNTRRVAAFISSVIQDSIQIVSSATNSVGPFLFTNIANVAGATAPTSPGATLFNATYKFTGAWRTGQVSASTNGGTVAESVGTDFPTNIETFRIGRLGNGTELSGHIRKIAYWPKRLTNTLLEQITT
jgi:hypothetical protein